MVNEKLLRIYLNDHLAGSVAGLELARRSAASNEGTPLGDFLEGLVRELEIDQRDLEAIMDELGLAKDALKQGAAWVAEKLGRLKLNGQIVGYSDLSRLVELEGLAIGIEGKMSLWRSLLHLVDRESTISEDVVAAALARAEKQRAAVEEQRLEAAAVALSGSADPAS